MHNSPSAVADHNQAAAYRRQAEADIRAAEFLLQQYSPAIAQALSCAQHAGEKILKALFAALGIEVHHDHRTRNLLGVIEHSPQLSMGAPEAERVQAALSRLPRTILATSDQLLPSRVRATPNSEYPWQANSAAWLAPCDPTVLPPDAVTRICDAIRRMVDELGLEVAVLGLQPRSP